MTQSPQLVLDFSSPLPVLTPDDIFDRADGPLLAILEEDRRIERKPPRVDRRLLGDYFSMWANTPPDGGLVVVGMGDDGELIGFLNESQDTINGIETAGADYCPDARHQIRRVPITNSIGQADFLILIRVFYNENRLARTVSGSSFMRMGSQKRKLDSGMEREIERDKRQVDSELEPTLFEYPDDFDSVLIDSYCGKWLAVRKLTDKSTTEVLTASHLGRMNDGEFRPNVSCALLFAKDPTLHFPGCKIRYLRFEEGHERTGTQWNAVKDVMIDGLPVPKLIQAAAQLVDGELRNFSRLNPGDGKFYTAPEYPPEAWYEAIVNACVHRSYGLKNMTIFIKRFDDRLEIESPGGFPPLVTPENIYDTHHARNPRLMEALRYLDFVKCAHEGARRMRDTMLGMDLPHPRFEQKERDYATVRVTLHNDIKHRRVWIDADVKDFVGSAILAELSEHDKRALNFIAEHGKINVSEFQRLTGLGWHGAKKRLQRLVQMRLLRHNIRKIHNPRGRDSKAHFVLRNGAQSEDS